MNLIRQISDDMHPPGKQRRHQDNLGIRFQRVADEHGQQTAIWFDEHDGVSYDELNRKSNRMARWLVDRGVVAKDVVCLSGEKSVDTFACMIACLKLGAVYCVLDYDSPAARLSKILAICQPRLLLAGRDLLDKLDETISNLGIEVIEKNSDQLAKTIGNPGDANLPQTLTVTGNDPAYIMFTSGSTGFPKGAVMTHANVLNLIEWSKDTFEIGPDEIVTNVNPLFFDNSVFDFYSALFNGARLVPFSRAEVKDPKRLVDKLDTARCTLWFSVPSLLIFLQIMKATDGKHLRSIRRFVFGGEGYPKAKLKSLYDAYSDTSEFFNVYGPTECTCICSCYKVTAGDFEDLRGLPPLGHITENFAFLILDEWGKAVPQGDVGELCLLGPNVGKGYYNDSDQTALSFVRNPYNDKTHEVMYKTGDLVKLDPTDGKLYIQGRRDNQIKHMGYRIELEEIEAALQCLDYVSEAAALHTTANGLSRIVAIVVSREEFDDERIRRDLERVIPSYMIPSVFNRESVLPKNPNGKVDRRQLAEKYLQSK